MPAPISGLRVTDGVTIWLTLDGKYRAIPDMIAYWRLFPLELNFGEPLFESSIPDEYVGDRLGADVNVIKDAEDDTIYFYNNDTKRHIVHWAFAARVFKGYRDEWPHSVIKRTENSPEGPIGDLSLTATKEAGTSGRKT